MIECHADSFNHIGYNLSTTLVLASPTRLVRFRNMRNRIKELRERKGLTQQQLAAIVETSNQQIGRLEKSRRKLSQDWMERLAPALDVDPADLLPEGSGEVPIVGHVGAASEMILYADGDPPGESAPMPPGGNARTVAVIVRGTSLGSFFDNWLVYYDDRRDPPGSSLLRHLCVVGLDDGRVLVKRLRKGSGPGLYHLESQTEELIEDARVIWAARVKHMSPR